MIPWMNFAIWTSRFQKMIGWRSSRTGIGFLLRKVKHDTILNVEDAKIHFNHRIAGGYIAAAAGRLGERETQSFFKSILDDVPADEQVRMIDVGANIGEISIGVARHKSVESVLAFEPQVECVKTYRINAVLNDLENKLHVNRLALTSQPGTVRFEENVKAPTNSRICSDAIDAIEVPASTLDIELGDTNLPIMIKIDVEGAELDVLKGGKELIRNQQPLIVFEYLSQEASPNFTLDQVRETLGQGYKIFRLRGDGKLDTDFNETWNCVAVHNDSPFYQSTQQLIAA